MAMKTKDSKNKLYKNHDILYNMLFLIVFLTYNSDGLISYFFPSPQNLLGYRGKAEPLTHC